MSQAAFRALMKLAADKSRELAQRMVQRAIADIPPLAARSSDIVERESMREAARVLMKHESALVEAFPQALLSEFAQALAGEARKAAAVNFDTLELMGDEQVQENLEAVRAQHAVLSACDGELRQLDALVCAAQGLAIVQPERNPLRVETYVRALRQVIQQSPVSATVRRRWMTHLAMALGPELGKCYHELADMLRAEGLSEASFRPAGATGKEASQQRHDADPNSQSLLNVEELRRLLAGDPAGSAQGQLPAAEFSMTMPAAFEALQELRQVEPVMRRLREQGLAGANPRTALQAIAMEVVHLMVENIAADARLLPRVREAVRGLEPALIRVARSDPRFFSDRRHPARQLLDEMTQRSLAWTTEDAAGFSAFIEPLAEAVQAFVESQVASHEAFDVALKALLEAWDDAEIAPGRAPEKAVRALVQAEQRNLLADRIAQELRERADVQGAPGEIRQFLAGPWAQVMAHARLTDATGAADPEGHAAIVADLVWSTQPDLARTNPARLARIALPLREHLARGLAAIDYPAVPAARFLDYVATLQGRAGHAAEEATTVRAEIAAQFTGEAEAGSWLAPVEARASSFVPAHPSIAQAADARGEDGIDLAWPELQPGAWVEMSEGGWTRWQLTWASPHGTLFMFTHPAGGAQSMTRRMLETMLRAGTLRTVTGRAVVDGALDAVAEEALRNSARLAR